VPVPLLSLFTHRKLRPNWRRVLTNPGEGANGSIARIEIPVVAILIPYNCEDHWLKQSVDGLFLFFEKIMSHKLPHLVNEELCIIIEIKESLNE